ncbi:MAG: hypothetical protein SGI87_12950 [Flavobacteriales bacterium]|nr:hypothetical protein [Flavobacteriales bacterium]
MSKKFTIIYLSIAPVLFTVSYLLSTKLFDRFMRYGAGEYEYQGKDYSLAYSAFFTLAYLAVFLVIKDLYKKRDQA